MKHTIFILLFAGFFASSLVVKAQEAFALGADVSWVTEMEKRGIKFYNAQGQQKECMQLLKEDLGMNSIRLRVWVNPRDGWCNTADVLVKAKRAHGLGMRLMIDFHYSDWWADPGKQNKPAAWVSLTLADLKQAVYDHTYEVLDTLRNHGIIPEWVQVGNETGNGMLWETGKASVSMSNYAQLHIAGYNAVKAISSDIKVIVHLHNGYNNSMYRWIFDGLKNNGAKWDMIGMSLYPDWYEPTKGDWQNANKDCLANMNDMVDRYGSEVMIVETGMSWDQPDTAFAFLSDLIAKTRSVKNNMGKGVMYWEPQSYGSWNSYPLGAFNKQGQPTKALDAFKNASAIDAVVVPDTLAWWNDETKSVELSKRVDLLQVYDLKGSLIQSASDTQSLSGLPLTTGVYLVETKTNNQIEVLKLICP